MKYESLLELFWSTFVFFISFFASLLFGFLLIREIICIYSGSTDNSVDRLTLIGILLVCSLFLPILKKVLCSINAVKFKDMEVILDNIDSSVEITQLTKEIHGCIYSGAEFTRKLSKAINDEKNDLIHYTFNEVVEYRERIVFEIIQAEGNTTLMNNRKSKLNRLIPIMKTIIVATKKGRDKNYLHKIYAQMAYILKDSMWGEDQYQNELQLAHKYISDAIAERPEGLEKYHIYEFNRLVLGINIENPQYKKHIEDDLSVVRNDNSCNHMLSDTNSIIAPNLSPWLQKKGLTNGVAGTRMKLGTTDSRSERS